MLHTSRPQFPAFIFSIAFIPLLLAASLSRAAEPGGEAKTPPEFKQVAEDPKLPRVLLIGDSISIAYTIPVRELLAGKANVQRIPANGATTDTGVKKIDDWLGAKKWDVIHFNWGLHDLKMNKDGKTHFVELPKYEANLRELVRKMKATGAKLIWTSTTPVPEGKTNPPRVPGDVELYNAAAKKIMDENQVAIDDLFALAQPRLAEIQQPVNVHFKPAGSKVLAEQVAAKILEALK